MTTAALWLCAGAGLFFLATAALFRTRRGRTSHVDRSAPLCGGCTTELARRGYLYRLDFYTDRAPCLFCGCGTHYRAASLWGGR